MFRIIVPAIAAALVSGCAVHVAKEHRPAKGGAPAQECIVERSHWLFVFKNSVTKCEPVKEPETAQK